MKLEERIREVLRFKQYSLRTEETYVGWYRQFVRFHELRHPGEMGAAEVEAFLTHLAVGRKVVAATQNQALNALVFLFKEVLGKPFEGWTRCALISREVCLLFYPWMRRGSC